MHRPRRPLGKWPDLTEDSPVLFTLHSSRRLLLLAAAGALGLLPLAFASSIIGPRTVPGSSGAAKMVPAPSIASAPQTSTGLPVRTPRTNLNADAGSDPQAGLPEWPDSGRGGPAPGSGTGTGSQTLPYRSPDQVRSRLAGFQRGTRRAETEQGQSPRAGEGSE